MNIIRLLIILCLGFLNLKAQSWVREFVTSQNSNWPDNIILSAVEWNSYIYASQAFADYTSSGSPISMEGQILKIDRYGVIVDSASHHFSSLALSNNKLYGFRENNGIVEIARLNDQLQVVDSLQINGIKSDLKVDDDGIHLLTFENGIIYHFFQINTQGNLSYESDKIVSLSSILQLELQFQTNFHGTYHYLPLTKHFWFNTLSNIVFIDSFLNPKTILKNPDSANSTSYSNYTSPRSIQLESGNIISNGTLRIDSLSTIPPYLLNFHYIRLRKWNQNFEVLDSLDFSHIAQADTQYAISQASITYPKQSVFFVAANSNPYLPHSKIVVAKVDTFLQVHWLKTFEHPDKNIFFYEINNTSDGGALISGAKINWVTKDDHSGYLIRIDSTGAILTTNDPLIHVEKDFITYPNPAKHEIYFSAQHDSKTIDIEIFDALGKYLVSEKNVKQTRLSLEGFSTGLYTYRIHCEDRISTGKFVKE